MNDELQFADELYENLELIKDQYPNEKYIDEQIQLPKRPVPPTREQFLCLKHYGFFSNDITNIKIVEKKNKKNGDIIERAIIIPDFNNVIQCLKHHPKYSKTKFTYSIFSQEEKINDKQISDSDILQFKFDLNKIFGYEPGTETVRNALTLLCTANEVNEVKDWFEALPPTNTNLLDTWLPKYFGVEDTELTRVIGRKWLIAAVSRAYCPGEHIEGMLILELHKGGMNKSLAFRKLCPKEEWFCEVKLDFSRPKETAEILRGKFIHENAELASISKADQETVKSWLTTQDDTYRPAFALKTKTVPRMINPCGSTNHDNYLTDKTGENRRFWGVKVSKIDIDGLISIKESLWREAVNAYKIGVKNKVSRLWTLTDSEKELLGRSNENRMVLDPIQEYLRSNIVEDSITTDHIMNYYLADKRYFPRNIPIYMRKLGFEPKDKIKSEKDPRKRARGWKRVRYPDSDMVIAQGYEYKADEKDDEEGDQNDE